jgi:hypothetical protein
MDYLIMVSGVCQETEIKMEGREFSAFVDNGWQLRYTG